MHRVRSNLFRFLAPLLLAIHAPLTWAACIHPNVVTTLAGMDYQHGYVDGTGTAARFHAPAGSAVDAAGNVYVINSGGTSRSRTSAVIRKISPQGVVTTLAGDPYAPEGLVDGQGGAARFNASTTGLAIDASGTLYVADSTAVRKVTPGGWVSTLAGAAAPDYVDGVGSGARFSTLMDIALDAAGNVYVTDQPGKVRKISPSGAVSTLAGSVHNRVGSADGWGTAALFRYPDGLAVNGAGDVFVADTVNHTIRRISAAGQVSTIAGAAGVPGSADGPGAAARFNTPRKLALDKAGALYVNDDSNYTIRRIADPAGAAVVSTVVGQPGVAGHVDGTGSQARLKSVLGLGHGVDAAGEAALYVSEIGSHTVRKIDCGCTAAANAPWTVSTVAGQTGRAGYADGATAQAQFYSPWGIAVNAAGELLIADMYNTTIRKLANGWVTTLAGQYGQQGSVDGIGSAAWFSGPMSVAVGTGGTVYVGDGSRIRAITPNGQVSMLAGGAYGYADGSGAQARFSHLYGLASDAAGNLYAADFGNHVIRRITPAGVVTTLAGLAGTAGHADGQGSAARFNGPMGIAAGADGSLYVADTQAHVIRRISPSGMVTTLAGLAGTAGAADGTGGAARFNGPVQVAVDQAGVVYVTEGHGSAVVRRVSPSGEVSTLAGLSGAAGSVDGAGTAARFSVPWGITVNPQGTVMYVSDAGNSNIRRLAKPTCSAAAAPSCTGLAVSPAGLSFLSTGGTQVLQVSAPAACQWHLSSRVGWVFGSPDTGVGNGRVSVEADWNPLPWMPRRAVLTVTGSDGIVTTVPVVQR